VSASFPLTDTENAFLRGSLLTTHPCLLLIRSYFVKDKLKIFKHYNTIFSHGLEGIA
jgi:hypothetical protein